MVNYNDCISERNSYASSICSVCDALVQNTSLGEEDIEGFIGHKGEADVFQIAAQLGGATPMVDANRDWAP